MLKVVERLKECKREKRRGAPALAFARSLSKATPKWSAVHWPPHTFQSNGASSDQIILTLQLRGLVEFRRNRANVTLPTQQVVVHRGSNQGLACGTAIVEDHLSTRSEGRIGFDPDLLAGGLELFLVSRQDCPRDALRLQEQLSNPLDLNVIFSKPNCRTAPAINFWPTALLSWTAHTCSAMDCQSPSASMQMSMAAVGRIQPAKFRCIFHHSKVGSPSRRKTLWALTRQASQWSLMSSHSLAN